MIQTERQTNPKVSVIIPCYNSERFLRECLDSVVGQTLQDIEIICVDDGSTDGTPDILREYAEKDSRVRILTQENQYAGVARNNGMDVATGKYLSFLDSDDFFEPVMLEKMYEKCEEDEADICVCGAGVYDMATKQMSFPAGFRPNIRVLPLDGPFSAQDIPNYVFNFCVPTPWNKLFRADFIKAYSLRYQPVAYANDVFFACSALAVAGKITVTDSLLLSYRIGAVGSLIEANKGRELCSYKAVEGLKDFLIKCGMFETHEDSYVNLAVSAVVAALRFTKTKERWLQTAVFLKNKFIPNLGLWDCPESMFRWRAAYDTMSFLMNSSYEELERFEPELRQDETTVRINDPSQNFALDDSLKVSVIIPVYNTEKYVEECIRSVMRQSLRDIEIICVDDGSTDCSFEIMERLANEDDRITVLQQENQGQAAARNKALNAAKGDYILFVDSDDLLVWCALEHLYRQAKFHCLDELIYEGASFYDPARLYLEYPWYYTAYTHKGDYLEPITGRQLLTATLENDDYHPTVWLRLYNRKFLQDHRIMFPEGIIHEDSIFVIRASNSVRRAWVHKEPLYLRRVRPESTMTSEKGCLHLYGHYANLLELEQMIACEDTEFISTLEKLHSRCRKIALSIYLAISESKRFIDAYERPEFPSNQYSPAMLTLFVDSLQRDAEFIEREDAYKKRIDGYKQRIETYKANNAARKEKAEANKAKEEAYKLKIADLKAKGEAHKQKIADLKAKEEAHKQRIADLKAKEETYKRKLAALKAKEAAYIKHKQKLDDIYRSRSWKLARILSAPMRLLRRIVSNSKSVNSAKSDK